MALQAFYQTVAQLCFTLLGLWWLVLQTKYAEWIGDPSRRRMITNISLYFLLPGATSLLALLSPQVHLLWQAAFIVASGLGVFETLSLVLGERESGHRTLRTAGPRWVGVVLYAAIAALAIISLVPAWGSALHGSAQSIAGILITLLIIAGVTLAWAYFIEPRPEDRA
jgi:Kef-type K+ transport system membrane component KefB